MKVKTTKLNVYEISADNEYSAYFRFSTKKLKNGEKTVSLDTDNSYLYDTKANVVAFLRAVADTIEAQGS